MSLRIRVVAAAVAAASVFCATLGPLRACLWDRDTLATEAKGLPEVVRVITGRFERNPPLYYEMRLTRAAGRVKTSPDDFAAYDDAGVSCDRLGRGDEAISWMDKKRGRLDAAGARGEDVSEHRYRYLANLGTFEAHRWFRNGADRDRIAEVESARGHIAEAVALNPNAHFGREPYQLKALDWVVKPPRFTPNTFRLPTFLDFGAKGDAARAEAPKAVAALTGLIALGNAWESVDVFNALIEALDADGGRTYLAMLAKYRCRELIEAGKTSVVLDAPRGEALYERLARPMSMASNEKELEALYRWLRAEADAWHEARTAYMVGRLKTGSHPDTDPNFWDDYHDPGPPSLDLPNLGQHPIAGTLQPSSHGGASIGASLRGLLILGAALVAAVTILYRRRRRAVGKTWTAGADDDFA